MESKMILVTGATGDTGSKVTQFLLEKGYQVRAFVHKHDERSTKLADLGAAIVSGDLLDFQSVRPALEGVFGAYFVYPIAPGLIEATAFFAQAAREAPVSHLVKWLRDCSRRIRLHDRPQRFPISLPPIPMRRVRGRQLIF